MLLGRYSFVITKMARTIVVIMCLSILFSLVQAFSYEPRFDDSFLPIKRDAINWLSENKHKNKHVRPQSDDIFNVDPQGNCREISIDLNLDNNFVPSVIQHVYCHNVNDPHLKYCLYKDLICHQKTESMQIADKTGTCMKGPEEHRRPIGCECKQNLQGAK